MVLHKMRTIWGNPARASIMNESNISRQKCGNSDCKTPDAKVIVTAPNANRDSFTICVECLKIFPVGVRHVDKPQSLLP